MCGSPKPSAAQMQSEALQLEMLKKQKEQMELMKADEATRKAENKEKALQEDVVRSSGSYGFRSLISGRRGGSGFGREMMG